MIVRFKFVEVRKPTLIKYMDTEHKVAVVTFDNGAEWLPKLSEVAKILTAINDAWNLNRVYDKSGRQNSEF